VEDFNSGGLTTMSIKDQLHSQLKWRAESLAATTAIINACEGLGLLDADFYIDSGDCEYVGDKSISGPYIRLEPKHVPGVVMRMRDGSPTLSLVDTTPTLGDAATVLLPKVGRWEKSFDESRNLIQLTGQYKGVRIVLQDAPPDTCKVRKVEEEVEVPEKVIAARTEKKVRYVMEGDCDPLLTARDTQPESVGNVAIAEEEQHGQ
jgi:hypothetical protein